MAKSRIKINLRKFFAKEAKKNIIGQPTTRYSTYKSLLYKKQGVRHDSAKKNKQSTIRRKGFDHWMLHTGETMRKGFLYKATKRSLLVYANPSKHSGKSFYKTKKVAKKPYKQKNPPTYKQLFQWHNQRGYSGVFGQLPVGSQFPKRLVKEVGKQVYPQIVKSIPKVVSKRIKL